jgi:hypothetical protein
LQKAEEQRRLLNKVGSAAHSSGVNADRGGAEIIYGSMCSTTTTKTKTNSHNKNKDGSNFLITNFKSQTYYELMRT